MPSSKTDVEMKVVEDLIREVIPHMVDQAFSPEISKFDDPDWWERHGQQLAAILRRNKITWPECWDWAETVMPNTDVLLWITYALRASEGKAMPGWGPGFGVWEFPPEGITYQTLYLRP